MNKNKQSPNLKNRVDLTVEKAALDYTIYRFTIADRGKYVAVVARWHNSQTAQKELVKVGQSAGKPVYTLRGIQPDEEAAKAKLNSIERGSLVGHLSLLGNPDWKVERGLYLMGFRSSIDGYWVITHV